MPEKTHDIKRIILITILVGVLLLCYVKIQQEQVFVQWNQNNGSPESWCRLAEPRSPEWRKDGLNSSARFMDRSHLQHQVERMKEAVNIPTESYDDNGEVGEDPRWKQFDKLHETLRDLFPLVHQEANTSTPNQYGLVYTFVGTSSSLKPILLTAHQDVVPASSASRWTHPPYDAFFDGKWLWGRGASDCKNNLIGILSTVESLLEQNWVPTRSVVLAFGFDEETGGWRGASNISEYLEDVWGQKSFEFILDEGGMGLQTIKDVVFARPAVTEKGYVDIILDLEIGGGHSSRPPTHTGIGIIAEMIVALEQNPFKPRLSHSNPFRGYLKCQVTYTPDTIEPWLKRALKSGEDVGVRLAHSRGDDVRFLMQTSQAVDVVEGGDKINALPEQVTVSVNYRVSTHESIAFVKKHAVAILRPIAKKHNLVVKAFENTHDSEEFSPGIAKSSPPRGTLHLSTAKELSPAPISSTDLNNSAWSLFSATLRQVFGDTRHGKDKTIVPVGDIMTGNTDTAHYWNLADNIYRFSPSWVESRVNAHTIDERIEMQSHLEAMRFYYDLIRNFDGEI